MKLQEAMKSGKPFKRKHWDTWWLAGSPYMYLGKDDIFAEDWEVGTETYQIGIEQFRDAASKAHSSVVWEFREFGRSNLYEEFLRILKQELGIK